MKIIRSLSEMKDLRQELSGTVALVPTLGGLHNGHIFHLKVAKKKSDVLIASIFLNPLQFSATEDLNSYPIDEKKDLKIFKKNGVDIAFLPDTVEMYGKGISTIVNPGKIAKVSEGKYRPGHFIGVATVVVKLFNLIQPHIATFGQKDAQQLQIIKNITQDLSLNVKIIEIPTIRDENGLALSTRNQYLNKAERKSACEIYKSLNMAKKLVDNKEFKTKIITENIRDFLKLDNLISIEYLEIVDPTTFTSINILGKKNLLVIAVHIGKARLIDNIILNT